MPGVPSVETCVSLPSTISPEPFGESVRFSFVPVVMSVPTPLNVSVPVVVIAPELTVPILTRFPDASILEVPLVWMSVVPLIDDAERVAVVPLSVKVRRVFGDPSASLMVNTPSVPAVASVTFGDEFVRAIAEAFESVTVPDASIVVAPAIAPVFVIPPALLLTPPVIEAPPELTVKSPAIDWAAVKLLFCPLYATFERVPVVLIFAPPTCNCERAFKISTDSVAVVPLSTSVRRVFGEPAESLIVKVPAASAAPNVITGFVLDKIIGEAFEKVFVLLNTFA